MTKTKQPQSPQLSFKQEFLRWADKYNSPNALFRTTTYDLSGGVPGEYSELFDHGFIVSHACVWGSKIGENSEAFEDREFAIVSRTYYDLSKVPTRAEGETFNEKFRGLTVVKLPIEISEPGVAIATVISKVGLGTNVFLNLCKNIDIDYLGFVLPRYMIDKYSIALKTNKNLNNCELILAPSLWGR